MHDLIGRDLWQLGKEQWAKKDILGLRDMAAELHLKKSRVRRCIITMIDESKKSAGSTVVREDKDGLLSSQR